MAPPTIPIEERFAKKYKVNKRTGCWMWTASLMPNGYAQFRYSKAKNGYGHRFSYEHHVGEIPEGRQLHHVCGNKACVNPEHLELVTPREHVLDLTDGRAAANAKKTHCPRGHPYAGDNVFYTSRGSRSCRECQRLWKEEHREEIRAYQREYMREYSRERYANDPEFREARKQQTREYTRKRYATDAAFREKRNQQSRESAARMREDARRWRDSQK